MTARAAAVVAGLLLALPAAGAPQASGAPRAADFVEAREVAGPFTDAQFTLRQGAALLMVLDQPVEGYREPYDLLLLGIVESAQATVPLHPRVGLHGEVEGQLTAGANPDTAFFLGARGGLRWEADAVIGLRTTERTRWAFRLRSRGMHGVLLEPARLVDAVLEDPETNIPALVEGDVVDRLLTTEDGWSIGPGISGAIQARPRVGVLLSAAAFLGTSRMRWWVDGTPTERRSTRGSLVAGAAGDLRPDRRGHWALGPELRLTVDGDDPQGSELDAAASGRVLASLGAYHVGQPGLQVGVIATSVARLRPAADDRFWAAELVLRYVFQSQHPEP